MGRSESSTTTKIASIIGSHGSGYGKPCSISWRIGMSEARRGRGVIEEIAVRIELSDAFFQAFPITYSLRHRHQLILRDSQFYLCLYCEFLPLSSTHRRDTVQFLRKESHRSSVVDFSLRPRPRHTRRCRPLWNRPRSRHSLPWCPSAAAVGCEERRRTHAAATIHGRGTRSGTVVSPP